MKLWEDRFMWRSVCFSDDEEVQGIVHLQWRLMNFKMYLQLQLHQLRQLRQLRQLQQHLDSQILQARYHPRWLLDSNGHHCKVSPGELKSDRCWQLGMDEVTTESNQHKTRRKHTEATSQKQWCSNGGWHCRWCGAGGLFELVSLNLFYR